MTRDSHPDALWGSVRSKMLFFCFFLLHHQPLEKMMQRFIETAQIPLSPKFYSSNLFGRESNYERRCPRVLHQLIHVTMLYTKSSFSWHRK